MKYKLYPYKLRSVSGKDLANELQCLRIKPYNSQYRGHPNHILINWGSSNIPNNMMHNCREVLNHPAAVACASNKLATFDKFYEHGIRTPEYTRSPEIAREWIEGYIDRRSNSQCDYKCVYARTKLRGHSGNGIVILRDLNDDFPVAQLYTKGIKTNAEFRAHVFKNQVIDVTQKLRRSTLLREEINFDVRNYTNGWVFARVGVHLPEQAQTLAVDAISALQLDFGAVDLIHGRDNNYYVLEVNTAPGLMGTTLSSYARAFNNYLLRI